MKICAKCLLELDLSCFSKNERRCKRCVSIAAKNRLKRGYYADYYQKHKKEITAREIRKRQTNPNFKIKCRLRSRIHKVLQNNQKSATTEALLGCSISALKVYLESQFQPGMTWENHGEWHIDHRLPCASFDLSNPDEQKACFHYTNLQPLWAADNLAKSDNILK